MSFKITKTSETNAASDLLIKTDHPVKKKSKLNVYIYFIWYFKVCFHVEMVETIVV